MGRKAAGTLSQQLRDAVDASGMSRYRICKELGLPESSLSRFMSGQQGLSLATLDRLVILLNLRLVAPARTPRSQQEG